MTARRWDDDEGHGTIVVTRGLLDTLSRDELQGVVAHEMAHLANLDTRYMVIVGVTVGLIALVCDMLLRTMAWGGSGRSSSSSDKKGSGGRASASILPMPRRCSSPAIPTVLYPPSASSPTRRRLFPE